MRAQVVTVSSRVPTEPYYHFQTFLDSLTRVGASATVLGMGEPWHGLMTKPRRLRDWLRAGQAIGDVLIVCDAWDIVFAAHPDEVAAEWLRMGTAVLGHEVPGWAIVFNAEKGLFPRGELAERFWDPLTPWRYLNSGFYVGAPADILALLEAMWLDDIHDDHQLPDGRWVNPNDQGWYQTLFCTQVVPMVLDTRCQLCQTFSGCALDEFDLDGLRLRNRVTGSAPLVYHFNGGSKNDIMPAVLAKMGLG